ncbi:MAG: ATP-binding protein [Ruminococcaceae bacterium]|nr:ATP-binding protein [Oscillospiraceae bacterium]
MAYNAENYKRIAAQFKDKSIRAQQAADVRKAELHEKLPQVAEIDRALATTGLRIMKEALNGRDGLQERVRRLEEGNKLLLEARAEILRASGYPEDYSDVHYECNECMDTGFVSGKMCKCLRTALNYAGYESSGVLKLIEKQNFQTFDLKYYEGNERKNMERIFHRALTYAANFDGKSMQNLLFVGTTGLGKTHLSSSIAKIVIDNGYDVLYESAQQIFADFEAERFGRVPYGENRTSRYFECDLLIIDDLGTEMQTQFTVPCLYNLINTRLISEKSMIISTNIRKEELLAKYSDRITSRLFGEFEICVFTGKDIRSQKLMKKIK